MFLEKSVGGVEEVDIEEMEVWARRTQGVSEETWGYVGTPAYVGLHKVTEMLFQFEPMRIFIF